MNGKGYELLLPEELHIKVDSVAPQIVLLAEMIYDYMVEKGYWDIPGSAGLYAYFCAASDLAKQFLIEQDISTHLKKQKMKNLFLSVRYDVAKIIKNRLLPLCRSIK